MENLRDITSQKNSTSLIKKTECNSYHFPIFNRSILCRAPSTHEMTDEFPRVIEVRREEVGSLLSVASFYLLYWGPEDNFEGICRELRAVHAHNH